MLAKGTPVFRIRMLVCLDEGDIHDVFFCWCYFEIELDYSLKFVIGTEATRESDIITSFTKKQKRVFVFTTMSLHREGKGDWNNFSWKAVVN